MSKTYLLIIPLFERRSIRDTHTESEGTSRFQLAISIGYSASVSESTSWSTDRANFFSGRTSDLKNFPNCGSKFLNRRV